VVEMTLVLSVLDVDVCLDDEDELEETGAGRVVLLLVVLGMVELLVLEDSEDELVLEAVLLLELDEDD